MARREAVVVIDAEGRDKGKIFHLREMSASRAEAWAARLLICFARSNTDVPEEVLEAGMAGVAAMMVRGIGGLSWAEAKPLLDEMMMCVRIQPDPSRPSVVRALMESAPGSENEDIEEIGTRIKLREELIALHTGFSIAAVLSKSMTDRKAAGSNGLNTSTSPEP